MEKSNWKVIARDIEQALEAIGKKHDLKFKMNGFRYSDTTCDYKVQAAVTKVNGKNFDAAKDQFGLYASYYGLKASDYGREFKTYHGSFKVVGIKTKAHRYPVIGEDVQTGRKFKFPAQAVLDGFKKSV